MEEEKYESLWESIHSSVVKKGNLVIKHAKLPEMYMNEGLSLLKIPEHPMIVKMLHADKEKQLIFFQYVPGNRVLKNMYDKEYVVSIIHQLLLAVLHCHQHDVYHRDINPISVMVTPDNKLVLLNFGFSTSEKTLKDGETTIYGHPLFLSPEYQYLVKQPNLFEMNDVFSTACLMHYLLHQKAPYEGLGAKLMQEFTKEYSLELLFKKPPTLASPYPWIDKLIIKMLKGIVESRPNMQECVFEFEEGLKFWKENVTAL